MSRRRPLCRMVAVVCLAVAGLLAAADTLSAQSVTLAWDANTESNLAGYRVRYGTQSGNHTTTVDAGNTTTRQITGLTAGTTYYFVVVAYNTSGATSGPSNQVSYTVPSAPTPPTPTAPVLLSVNPGSGPTSGGTSITLAGANFEPGATVRVGNAPATGVQVLNQSRIRATTPPGSAGGRTVQVTNPDGRSASMANGFTYQANGSDDTDGDGLPDAWETQYGLNPGSASGSSGANGDPDRDGIVNRDEWEDGSHPRGTFKRYLAEGALNGFFDTRIAIANAGSGMARTLVSFQDSQGRITRQYLPIPGRSRRTIVASAYAELANEAFSTLLESDQEVGLDRLMSWDGVRYATHTETAVEQPATTWYLAEGATSGPFELFYLIQNPSGAAADIQVRYLRENGEPITKFYTVGPRSRFTIWVDVEDSALGSASVSAEIVSTNDVPVIVERSMYLNAERVFKGGHNSAGVNEPATSWFLAEGATGGFFSMYMLIANPNTAAAQVKATYLRDDGAPIVRNYTVEGNRRFTVNVAQEDERLADTSMAVRVESTNGVPIIVERSMWWPGRRRSWTEGHNAFGTTTTGPRWLLSEGEIGGPQSIATFVLIANTSTVAASVKVTLLFEDEAEESVTYEVDANRRFTVPLESAFPSSQGRRFSVLVESLTPEATSLVVERAMYWNTDDDFWGAGANSLGARLR